MRIQCERISHQLAEKELELEKALAEASAKVGVVFGVGVDGILGDCYHRTSWHTHLKM